MKFLVLLTVLPLLFLSCHKGKTNTKQTCYKGRFVAEGCWTVIQLLEPLHGGLPTSRYDLYENAFGTGNVPKQYKDGQPFYFTVNRVDSNITYTLHCTPTKYIAEIDSFSNTSCGR